MQATTDTPHDATLAHNQVRKRVITWCLLAALTLGSVAAGSWMVGEISLVTTRRTLDLWAEAGEVQSLAEWEAAQNQLAFAMKLLPDSSEHYELIGLLHEWRFFVADSPIEAETDIVRIRQTAIDAQRRSAELRPAWPMAWVELARQKAMLGQEDEELLLALERGLVLGPNEESVRLLVTDVATLSWSYIAANESLRDKVITSIARSLSPPQNDTMLPHLIYITDRNMQAELCPLLPVDQLAEWAQEACALPYPQVSSE